eukprot:2016523-Prymnesium_polylepis.1
MAKVCARSAWKVQLAMHRLRVAMAKPKETEPRGVKIGKLLSLCGLPKPGARGAALAMGMLLAVRPWLALQLTLIVSAVVPPLVQTNDATVVATRHSCCRYICHWTTDSAAVHK